MTDDLLNLDGVPEEKIETILNSYHALADFNTDIIDDKTIIDEILSGIANFNDNRTGVIISIINLFRLSLPNGIHYIAQVQMDSTYIFGKTYYFNSDGMEYYIWGMSTVIDTSTTLTLSARSAEDKIANTVLHLFHKSLNHFETGNPQFDKKYIVETNTPTFAMTIFDHDIANLISQTTGLNVAVADGVMRIGFLDQLDQSHTSVLARFFKSLPNRL